MQRDSVTNNESLSSGSVADFERNGSEFVADFERNGSEFVADSAGSTMYFAGDFSRSVAFKKFLLVAISIFSFGTILAGCNILPDTKTVQSYDGEFADFKEVPEISKMVPDSIRQTGKLTAGVNAGYAPAEVIVTNEITGYEVDLFIAISRVLGLEPEMLQAEFDSIVPAVGYKYNLGISAFTITDERKEVVDFI
ncbi:MAG: transporter substrate-binding domain-containing protein, partial [Bifidobacteriaceae bacterium]|nr:transporter substrate-binding domain-containing protein [Bifidobacteriaceae bacterium]